MLNCKNTQLIFWMRACDDLVVLELVL